MKQGYSVQRETEQEKLLLEDLISVGKFIESHKTNFRIARLSPDRFDELSIYIPIKNQGTKIVVRFNEYPANRPPQIESKNSDELSWLVTKLIRDALSKNKGPIRLQTVINIAMGIVTHLNEEDDLHESETEKTDQGLVWLVNKIKYIFFGQKKIEYEYENQYDNAAKDFKQVDQYSSDESYTPKNNKKNSSRVKNEWAISNAPQVNEIIIPQRMITEIIEDFQRFKPNEYGFICSGLLRESGLAVIFDYYPGEMKISTPVYCELTDRFIEKVIYDWIPDEHNLLIWGHVHPIEGPSHTDSASFEEIAKWDIDIREHNVIQKRSIAMLINAHTYSVRLYDVHLQKLIKNNIVSSPRYHGYNS